MKRLIAGVVAIAAVLVLAGCGSSGSSASPPTDVAVVPGDGYVTATWTMSPGVDYWMFYAPTSGNLTPETCGSSIVCVDKGACGFASGAVGVGQRRDLLLYD